jgi:transposase
MEERTYLPEGYWLAFKPQMEMLARFGRKTNLRLFLEAVLWILRTGCPWRDLHVRFGPWNTMYRRFRRWALSGRWCTLQQRLQRELCEVSTLLVDSTAVRAHGHAAGAQGGQQQALGRSRGGFGTKIHAVVSDQGQLLAMTLTGAQRSDIGQAPPLLSDLNLEGRTVIADKAYDSDRLVEVLTTQGCNVVIPSRKGRLRPRTLDRVRYGERNLVERFFGRLKQYRRVATRYDKTIASFAASVQLAAAFIAVTGWPS